MEDKTAVFSDYFAAFRDFRKNAEAIAPLRDLAVFPARVTGDFDRTYIPQRLPSDGRMAILGALRKRLEDETSDASATLETFREKLKALEALNEVAGFLPVHADFMGWAAENFLRDASVVALQDHLTAFRTRLSRHLLKKAARDMEAEGFGPPPTAFAWMALGSDGRGEQLFATDQDNLLIYESTEKSQVTLRGLPDPLLNRFLRFEQGEHLKDIGKIDLTGRYYAVFCGKMGDYLDAVGIDKCKGHIMPAYEKWRGTLPRWERKIIGKIKYGAGDLSVLDINILMDCRFVAGDDALGGKFLDMLHARLPENGDILSRIAHSAILMPIALGMFKRLKVQKKGKDRGTLNLKLNGWAPLTILVRVLCVKNGIWETHTLKRIDALAANRLLDEKSAGELKEAYHHLMTFRALYQMARIANGLPAANAADPNLLDAAGQELLRHSLGVVESFQDRINQSFFGGNS